MLSRTIGSVTLVTVFLAGVTFAQDASGPERLTLVPRGGQTSITQAGGTITVDVYLDQLDPANPIMGVQYNVAWDPTSCWHVDEESGDGVIPAPGMIEGMEWVDAGFVKHSVNVPTGSLGIVIPQVIASLIFRASDPPSGCCVEQLCLTLGSGASGTRIVGVPPYVHVPIFGACPTIRIDLQDPTITCGADIVGNMPPGQCSWTPSTGQPIALPTYSDNCTDCTMTSPTFVRSDGRTALSSPYDYGLTTITWTVADCCGRQASCQQNITVEDNEPPVISPGSMVREVCANGDYQFILPDWKLWVDPSLTVTDNCTADPQVMMEPPAGTIFDVGEHDVMVAATDSYGNNSSCVVTFVVKDPGCSRTWYRDADSDGYGTPSDTEQSPTQPAGYVANHTDCNDGNSAIHPGAIEVCGNGVDEDCNGLDLLCIKTWYRDADSDGYGNPSDSKQSTTQPTGYVLNNTDCNDGNSAIHPGAIEVCGNGVDDDCNGQDLLCDKTWYRDADSDGYGNPGDSQLSPTQPAGYVLDNTDCDDANSAIHPGATEICGNGVDEDCSGQDLLCDKTWYRDADSDGYGNPGDSQLSPTQPTGYVLDNNDCDDGSSAVHPGATEICGNGVDEDCNGQDLFCDKTWYRDADSDGYGNPGDSQLSPTQPTGYVLDNNDCDDGSSAVHPGATEICGNGVDDDCNGQDLLCDKTWYRDADSDGYGNLNDTKLSPTQPSGYVLDSTDCNDSSNAIHPGATEACGNGVDEDCDGQDPPCGGYAADSDGDGIADVFDKCPQTTHGAQVDAKGCAADQRDSDGDGVKDNVDKCPNTPPGTLVGVDGCPAALDTDLDGVSDVLDKCPGTLLGDIVRADGCSACQADDDGDGVPNCTDACADDPDKVVPGDCGCNVPETFACGQPIYTLRVIGPDGTEDSALPYVNGTLVIITAPPAPEGKRFAYWSGDVSGTDNPLEVVVDGDKIIVAVYEDCPLEQAWLCGPGVPVCGLATMICLGLMRVRSRRVHLPIRGNNRQGGLG